MWSENKKKRKYKKKQGGNEVRVYNTNKDF